MFILYIFTILLTAEKISIEFDVISSVEMYTNDTSNNFKILAYNFFIYIFYIFYI